MATLLTGVGYIGATLLRRLADRGERVVAIDNYYSTDRDQLRKALPPEVELVEGDVADAHVIDRAFDALGNAQRITVYHLAAQPSATVAAREPELTERTNLLGARLVLQAAHERGAHVVFGGSFRVYGDELVGQEVDESTPYGRVGDLSHLSKVYVEQLARMLGVPFTSVRLGVTYGLSDIMKTAPAFMTVPNLFCRRAAQGEILRVLEDRPMAFIHVQDGADALLQAARARPQTWDVVNAAPQVATIGQVARVVQQLARDRGISVCIEGARPAEDGFVVRSKSGLAPRYSLEDGLGEVLDSFSHVRR